MQLPQLLARFNRHVTNPIQRMWAGWAPSFGILEHVGRRSGKPYHTPLTVFNAAGGGKMRRHGKTFSVSNPQTVTKEQAATHVSGAAHRVFGRLPFEQAVLLTKTG